jgi:pilus assembly protein CpaB
MARGGAGGPAGRINRRFLMLALVSAALSAILVYVAISRNAGTTKEGESTETTASTVVAAVDIPARTQITDAMVELRDIPLSARSSSALSSLDDAVGMVTRYPIVAEEQVTSAKVVSLAAPQEADSLSFVVPQGMRAISIQADQVLSAGGLVLPGDYVDVMSIIKGKNPDGSDVDAYVVRTLLQNVEVLAVAQTLADTSPGSGEETSSADGQNARASEAKPNPDATTLTLLVTPEQAEWLFLAEANGTLRAVVRAFGDADVTEVRPIYQTELYPGGAPPAGG